MKVKLKSTGKVVTIETEMTPDLSFRAAELADVPANMSLADQYLYGIAIVMVYVKSTQAADEEAPKTIEDLVGKNVESKDMLLAFRRTFSDQEWSDLSYALAKVSPAPKHEPGFEVAS